MKKLTCLTVLGVLLSLVLMAAPASAASSLATCTGSWNVSLSPGALLTTSRDITFGTPVTGTINCLGSVNGSPVTGQGTVTKTGQLTGSCVAATGSGTFAFSIPTAGGQKNLTVPFTMITGFGYGVKFSSSFVGPLAFAFVPVQGNCITSPLTEIHVVVAAFTLQS